MSDSDVRTVRSFCRICTAVCGELPLTDGPDTTDDAVLARITTPSTRSPAWSSTPASP